MSWPQFYMRCPKNSRSVHFICRTDTVSLPVQWSTVMSYVVHHIMAVGWFRYSILPHLAESQPKLDSNWNYIHCNELKSMRLRLCFHRYICIVLIYLPGSYMVFAICGGSKLIQVACIRYLVDDVVLLLLLSDVIYDQQIETPVHPSEISYQTWNTLFSTRSSGLILSVESHEMLHFLIFSHSWHYTLIVTWARIYALFYTKLPVRW